jgi:UDP-glucose 4-epimerase
MVDLLLERNYTVRVIDNLVEGREANLAHHAADPRLSFERMDAGRRSSPHTQTAG